MPTPTTDFLVILRTLAENDVDFIVVGGIGAVLHGAPVTTFDLEVVHSRKPENLERLSKALHRLDAHYREHRNIRLTPRRSHLASQGHQLLMTNAGPLDLLGTVAAGRGYEELLPHSTELSISDGLSVQLLDLATLIAIKEETGRDKDKAVLPTLRRTLEEKRRT